MLVSKKYGNVSIETVWCYEIFRKHWQIFKFILILITKPDGSYKTVGYSAGVDGYKTLPLEEVSPFGLAPFPHDMDGEDDKEQQPISA